MTKKITMMHRIQRSLLLVVSVFVFFLSVNKQCLAVAGEVETHAQADTLSGISNNWAGYEAVDGVFMGVGARWQVPKLARGTVSSTYAVWVGMGGEFEHDLIQVGIRAKEGGRKGVVYTVWYEMFPDKPHALPLSIAPGDLVRAAIMPKDTKNWIIAFENSTKKKKTSISILKKKSFQSAEWTVERSSLVGGGVSDFGYFDKVVFTDVWAIKNGRKKTLFTAHALPISMVDSADKKLLAHVSATGAEGKSFTVVRDKPGEAWLGLPGYANAH